MKTDGKIILLLVVIGVVFLCIYFSGSISGFTFKFYPTPSKSVGGLPSGVAFSNAEYQDYPPSIDLQSDYYTCIAEACGGNTFDYPCLEKCHLKAFRRYMPGPDHADWVCYDKRFNPSEYYKCLDRVYTDYKYP